MDVMAKVKKKKSYKFEIIFNNIGCLANVEIQNEAKIQSRTHLLVSHWLQSAILLYDTAPADNCTW